MIRGEGFFGSTFNFGYILNLTEFRNLLFFSFLLRYFLTFLGSWHGQEAKVCISVKMHIGKKLNSEICPKVKVDSWKDKAVQNFEGKYELKDTPELLKVHIEWEHNNID